MKYLRLYKLKKTDHLMILTSNGKGLRFDSQQLSDQGRVTSGVRGIKLKENDNVVNILKVEDDKLLLIAGKNGLE